MFHSGHGWARFLATGHHIHSFSRGWFGDHPLDASNQLATNISYGGRLSPRSQAGTPHHSHGIAALGPENPWTLWLSRGRAWGTCVP
jgi:hypothetical protein